MNNLLRAENNYNPDPSDDFLKQFKKIQSDNQNINTLAPSISTNIRDVELDTYYRPFIAYGNNDMYRAEDQPLAEQWWKGLRKTGNVLTVGVLKGFADSVDVARAYLSGEGLAALVDEDFQNIFSKALGELQDANAEKNQIYKEPNEEGFNPLKGAWWADNLASIASSLTMLIPTMAAAKGTSLLLSSMGRLAKAGSTGAKIAKGLGLAEDAFLMGKTGSGLVASAAGSLWGNQLESLMEVQGILPEMRQKLEMSGKYSPEQIEEILKKEVNKNVKGNLINAPLDMIGIFNMLKPYGGISSVLTSGVKNTLVKEIIPEAAQEVVNAFTTNRFQRNIDISLGLTDSNYSLKDLFSDPNTLTAAFFGGLGGGVFTAGGSAFNQIQENITSQSKENKPGIFKGVGSAVLSGLTTSQKPVYQLQQLAIANLAKVETDLKAAMKIAELSGNKELYTQLQEQLQDATAATHMSLGTYGRFMKHLDSVDSVLAQGITELEKKETLTKEENNFLEDSKGSLKDVRKAKVRFQNIAKFYSKGENFYGLKNPNLQRDYALSAANLADLEAERTKLIGSFSRIMAEDEFGVVRSTRNKKITEIEEKINNLTEKFRGTASEDSDTEVEEYNLNTRTDEIKTELQDLQAELAKIDSDKLTPSQQLQKRIGETSLKILAEKNNISDVLDGTREKLLEEAERLEKDTTEEGRNKWREFKTFHAIKNRIDSAFNRSLIDDLIYAAANEDIEQNANDENVLATVDAFLKENLNISESARTKLLNLLREKRSELLKKRQEEIDNIWKPIQDEFGLVEEALDLATIDPKYLDPKVAEAVNKAVVVDSGYTKETQSINNSIDALSKKETGFKAKSRSLSANILRFFTEEIDKMRESSKNLFENSDPKAAMTQIGKFREQIRRYQKFIDTQKFYLDKDSKQVLQDQKKLLKDLNEELLVLETELYNMMADEFDNLVREHSQIFIDLMAMISSNISNTNKDITLDELVALLKKDPETLKQLLSAQKEDIKSLWSILLPIIKHVSPINYETLYKHVNVEHLVNAPEILLDYFISILESVNKVNISEEFKISKNIYDLNLETELKDIPDIKESVEAINNLITRLSLLKLIRITEEGKATEKEIVAAESAVLNETEVALFPDQRMVLFNMIKFLTGKNTFSQFTGTAGTGKTFLLAQAIKILIKLKVIKSADEVLLSAPGDLANEVLNAKVGTKSDIATFPLTTIPYGTSVKEQEDLLNHFVKLLENKKIWIIDEGAKLNTHYTIAIKNAVAKINSTRKSGEKLKVIFASDPNQITELGGSMTNLNQQNTDKAVIPNQVYLGTLKMSRRVDNANVLAFQKRFLSSKDVFADNLTETFDNEHYMGVKGSVNFNQFLEDIKRFIDERAPGEKNVVIIVDNEAAKSKFRAFAGKAIIVTPEESQGIEADYIFIDSLSSKTAFDPNSHKSKNKRYYVATSRAKQFIQVFNPSIIGLKQLDETQALAEESDRRFALNSKWYALFLEFMNKEYGNTVSPTVEAEKKVTEEIKEALKVDAEAQVKVEEEANSDNNPLGAADDAPPELIGSAHPINDDVIKLTEPHIIDNAEKIDNIISDTQFETNVTGIRMVKPGSILHVMLRPGEFPGFLEEVYLYEDNDVLHEVAIKIVPDGTKGTFMPLGAKKAFYSVASLQNQLAQARIVTVKEAGPRRYYYNIAKTSRATPQELASIIDKFKTFYTDADKNHTVKNISTTFEVMTNTNIQTLRRKGLNLAVEGQQVNPGTFVVKRGATYILVETTVETNTVTTTHYDLVSVEPAKLLESSDDIQNLRDFQDIIKQINSKFKELDLPFEYGSSETVEVELDSSTMIRSKNTLFTEFIERVGIAESKLLPYNNQRIPPFIFNAIQKINALPEGERVEYIKQMAEILDLFVIREQIKDENRITPDSFNQPQNPAINVFAALDTNEKGENSRTQIATKEDAKEISDEVLELLKEGNYALVRVSSSGHKYELRHTYEIVGKTANGVDIVKHIKIAYNLIWNGEKAKYVLSPQARPEIEVFNITDANQVKAFQTNSADPKSDIFKGSKAIRRYLGNTANRSFVTTKVDLNSGAVSVRNLASIKESIKELLLQGKVVKTPGKTQKSLNRIAKGNNKIYIDNEGNYVVLRKKIFKPEANYSYAIGPSLRSEGLLIFNDSEGDLTPALLTEIAEEQAEGRKRISISELINILSETHDGVSSVNQNLGLRETIEYSESKKANIANELPVEERTEGTEQRQGKFLNKVVIQFDRLTPTFLEVEDGGTTKNVSIEDFSEEEQDNLKTPIDNTHEATYKKLIFALTEGHPENTELVKSVLSEWLSTVSPTNEDETTLVEYVREQYDNLLNAPPKNEGTGPDEASLLKGRTDISDTTVSREQAISYIRQLIPSLTQEEAEEIFVITQAISVDGVMHPDALGLFKQGIIYILSKDKGNVNYEILRHETFHKVFRQFFTASQREALIKKARKEFDLTEFAKKLGKSKESLTNYDIEEYLAERFQKFNINQSVNKAPKGFWANLFFNLRTFMLKILKFLHLHNESINDIFTQIEKGTFGKQKLEGDADSGLAFAKQLPTLIPIIGDDANKIADIYHQASSDYKNYFVTALNASGNVRRNSITMLMENLPDTYVSIQKKALIHFKKRFNILINDAVANKHITQEEANELTNSFAALLSKQANIASKENTTSTAIKALTKKDYINLYDKIINRTNPLPGGVADQLLSALYLTSPDFINALFNENFLETTGNKPSDFYEDAFVENTLNDVIENYSEDGNLSPELVTTKDDQFEENKYVEQWSRLSKELKRALILLHEVDEKTGEKRFLTKGFAYAKSIELLSEMLKYDFAGQRAFLKRIMDTKSRGNQTAIVAAFWYNTHVKRTNTVEGKTNQALFTLYQNLENDDVLNYGTLNSILDYQNNSFTINGIPLQRIEGENIATYYNRVIDLLNSFDLRHVKFRIESEINSKVKNANFEITKSMKTVNGRNTFSMLKETQLRGEAVDLFKKAVFELATQVPENPIQHQLNNIRYNVFDETSPTGYTTTYKTTFKSSYITPSGISDSSYYNLKNALANYLIELKRVYPNNKDLSTKINQIKINIRSKSLNPDIRLKEETDNIFDFLNKHLKLFQYNSKFFTVAQKNYIATEFERLLDSIVNSVKTLNSAKLEATTSEPNYMFDSEDADASFILDVLNNNTSYLRTLGKILAKNNEYLASLSYRDSNKNTRYINVIQSLMHENILGLVDISSNLPDNANRPLPRWMSTDGTTLNNNTITAHNIFLENRHVKSVEGDEKTAVKFKLVNPIYSLVTLDAFTQKYNGKLSKFSKQFEKFTPQYFYMHRVIASFIDEVAKYKNNPENARYFQWFNIQSNRPTEDGIAIDVFSRDTLKKAIIKAAKFEAHRRRNLLKSDIDVKQIPIEYFLPFFTSNTIKGNIDEEVDLSFDNQEALTEGVNSFLKHLEENIEKAYTQFKGELLSTGTRALELENMRDIIENAYDVLTSSQKNIINDSELGELVTKHGKQLDAKLFQVFKSFYIQNYVGSFHANMLAFGDPHMAKGPEDYIKRLQVIKSPAKFQYIDYRRNIHNKHLLGNKPTAKIVDVEDSVQVIDELNDMNRIFSKMYNLPFEYTDAVTLGTPTTLKYLQLGTGDYTHAELLKILGSGNQMLPDGSVITHYIKTNLVIITDEHIQNYPELARIRREMEQHGMNEDDKKTHNMFYKRIIENKINSEERIIYESMLTDSIEYYVMKSAHKTGSKNRENRVQNNESIQDKHVYSIPNSIIKIQSNPVKKPEGVSNPSQFVFFSSANGLNEAEFYNITKLDSVIMRTNWKNFVDKMRLLDENGNLNKKVFMREVLEILSVNPSDDKLYDLVKNNLNVSQLLQRALLDYPILSQRLNITLTKMFVKNGIDIKHSGGKYINQSDIGVRFYQFGANIVTYKGLTKGQKEKVKNFSNLNPKIQDALNHILDTLASTNAQTPEEQKNITDWIEAKYKIIANRYDLTSEDPLFKQYEDIVLNIVIPKFLDPSLPIDFLFSRRLQLKDKDGRTEVIMPLDIVTKLYNKLGYSSPKDMEDALKTDPSLLNLVTNMLAIRIPTTGIHSAIAIKVIITSDPKINSIIVPRELTALHGSDFDVDSLTVMRKEFQTFEIKSQSLKDLLEKYKVPSTYGTPIGYAEVVINKNTKRSFSYNLYGELQSTVSQIVKDRTSIVVQLEAEISALISKIKDLRSEALNDLDVNNIEVVQLLINEKKEELKEYKKVKSQEIKEFNRYIVDMSKNEKLDVMMSIITSDKNREDVNTPITFAPIKHDSFQNLSLDDFYEFLKRTEGKNITTYKKTVIQELKKQGIKDPDVIEKEYNKILIAKVKDFIINVQKKLDPITIKTLNITDLTVPIISPEGLLEDKIIVSDDVKAKLLDRTNDVGLITLFKTLTGYTNLRLDMDVNDIATQLAFHQLSFQSKSGIGIQAVMLKITNYLMQSSEMTLETTELNDQNVEVAVEKKVTYKDILTLNPVDEKGQVVITFKNGKKYTGILKRKPVTLTHGNFEGITINGHNYKTLERRTVLGRSTMENGDTITNGYIDNVKEMITDLLMAGTNTIEVIGLMTAMGIELKDTALFMNQPVMNSVRKLPNLFALDGSRFKITQFSATIEELKRKAGTEINLETVKLTSENMMEIVGKFYGKDLPSVIESMTQKEALLQLKVLDYFKKLHSFKDPLRNVSNVISALRNLPIEARNLDILIDAIDKTSTPSKMGFNAPNFQGIPNISEAIYRAKDFKSYQGKLLFIHSPEVYNFLEGVKKDLGLRYGFFKNTINPDTIDFLKGALQDFAFIRAVVQNPLIQEMLETANNFVGINRLNGNLVRKTSDNKYYELTKSNKETLLTPEKMANVRMLQKHELWMQEFLTRVKINYKFRGEFKDNKFLEFIQVNANQNGELFLRFERSNTKDPLLDNKIKKGFSSLPIDIQDEFVLYSMITSSIGFGTRNYSIFIPDKAAPNHINGQDFVMNAFSQSLRSLVDSSVAKRERKKAAEERRKFKIAMQEKYGKDEYKKTEEFKEGNKNINKKYEDAYKVVDLEYHYKPYLELEIIKNSGSLEDVKFKNLNTKSLSTEKAKSILDSFGIIEDEEVRKMFLVVSESNIKNTMIENIKELSIDLPDTITELSTKEDIVKEVSKRISIIPNWVIKNQQYSSTIKDSKNKSSFTAQVIYYKTSNEITLNGEKYYLFKKIDVSYSERNLMNYFNLYDSTDFKKAFGVNTQDIYNNLKPIDFWKLLQEKVLTIERNSTITVYESNLPKTLQSLKSRSYNAYTFNTVSGEHAYTKVDSEIKTTPIKESIGKNGNKLITLSVERKTTYNLIDVDPKLSASKEIVDMEEVSKASEDLNNNCKIS